MQGGPLEAQGLRTHSALRLEVEEVGGADYQG